MPDALLGSHVGPYRIVEPLGEGGMGAVYLAERADRQFQKRVAIKVLKRGADSVDALRRFETERQVLASLDHPCIVRLLDAGVTAAGDPCVIMDYVDGVPIDQYCAASKPSLAQRLRLFTAICSAVHYAHQRLVIHCDIKPANIIVAADGSPKLLDFGIGKLLSENAADPDGGALTLDHASPEQILGLPVTTATDIYLLGVVLYEMLTGRPPFVATTGIEFAYKITRTDAGAPSMVAGDKALEGDLDAIVQKAVSKDSAARYASVAEMADDVERHLDSRPISLLSASPRYRISKFVARHRTAAVAAVVGLVLLIAATTGAIVEGFIAREQRARAERRFADVRRLVGALLFDFYDAASKIPGATSLQMHLVQRSVEYLDSLASEVSDDVPLAADLVDAYTKFGDIQGNPYQQNLGDTTGAMASYQKGLAIAERLLKSHPRDARLLERAARAHQELADVQAMMGKSSDAIGHVQKAAAMFESLALTETRNIQRVIDLASCLEGMGDQLGHPGLISMGNEQGALDAYRRSLDKWRDAVRLDGSNARAKRATAILSMKIANIESARGNSAAALSLYREALATASGLPPEARSRRTLATLERKLGEELSAARSSEGEPHLRRALEEFENLSATDPLNAQARLDLADGWHSLADYYEGQNNTTKSFESLGKAADILESLNRADPSNNRFPAQLSQVLLRIGALLVKSGQIEEATHQTRRGLELIRTLADDPNAPADELQRAAAAFADCLPQSLRDPVRAAAYAKRAEVVQQRN